MTGAFIVGSTALLWHRDGAHVQVRSLKKKVGFTQPRTRSNHTRQKQIHYEVPVGYRKKLYILIPGQGNRQARWYTPLGNSWRSSFVARTTTSLSTGQDPLHSVLAPSCYQQVHIKHLPAIPTTDISKFDHFSFGVHVPLPVHNFYVAVALAGNGLAWDAAGTFGSLSGGRDASGRSASHSMLKFFQNHTDRGHRTEGGVLLKNHIT